MVIFKEKKKKQNTKDELRITLDAEHTKQINIFNDKKKNLNKLKKNLGQLTSQYLQLNTQEADKLTPDQLEHKMTLKENILKLTKEISIIQSHQSVNKYLLHTSNMLYQYYDDTHTPKKTNNDVINNNQNSSIIDMFISNKTNNNTLNTEESNCEQKNTISTPQKDKYKQYTKTEIITKYNEFIEKGFVYSNNSDNGFDMIFCKKCNVERIFHQAESVMICPTCAQQEQVLVDSDKPSYKEPPREISYFAYKRINHFNEWLAQFQAKESTDIPKDIYKIIKLELNKETYIQIDNLKIAKVRDILKKLGLNKYYEHVPHIINRLSGNPAPIIDRTTEEKLRIMFKEIQTPWMEHCPNKRSNFLSYSYVLFKCLQLLEMDEYLSNFSLLKSREKLAEQDKIWKLICNDLKWEYIKTI